MVNSCHGHRHTHKFLIKHISSEKDLITSVENEHVRFLTYRNGVTPFYPNRKNIRNITMTQTGANPMPIHCDSTRVLVKNAINKCTV